VKHDSYHLGSQGHSAHILVYSNFKDNRRLSKVNDYRFSKLDSREFEAKVAGVELSKIACEVEQA
jgi:hypothetical protein